MLKTVSIAATTLVVAALAATSGVTATPASATTIATSSVTMTETHAASFTDRDVISLLVGQGKLLDAHPDLAGYVPDNGRPLTTAEITALVAEYQQADPSFHDNVTIPIQSGDPYRTLDALTSFGTTTAALSTEQDSATGDGKCVVVLAAAILVWVAVATEVWVKGVTESSDGGVEFAAAIANAFSE